LPVDFRPDQRGRILGGLEMHHVRPWIDSGWPNHRLPADWSSRKIKRGWWRMNYHPISLHVRTGIIVCARLHNPVTGMIEATYLP
jgi:hypothetical protein